ncbi:MHFG family PEP-CTERM protein [Pseudoduganella sp. SL102]|uniref:MHFG family PEP-CTERM protein n=1 Tax=Pseudoduganella sp. SL102 TaxID=2995154 RepID=UPI00248CB67E|nr:MHFG family PEP-CTERM protein [Pseudoduganella sp. SL102]WBS05611.1 MHFG family PEP-CTERM protein [Pseudoduganella sp. SL102]
MSTLVASAVVATAMLSNCSWNHPGRNPYRGTVGEAVSRYIDIPAPVRTRLIAKIESGQADDTAAIMRDTIAGKYDYSPQITDMHFGQRTVCGAVTRDEWAATRREMGKVYCVDNHCLIVPKICGNISRVHRVAGEGGGGGIGGGAAPATVAVPRPAAPGWVRAASPDEVAAADTMAEMATTPMTQLSGFASPFGTASYAPDLTSRNPSTDTGLAQPGPAPSPVPEPATFGMLGAGLAVLCGVMRRRARREAAPGA